MYTGTKCSFERVLCRRLLHQGYNSSPAIQSPQFFLLQCTATLSPLPRNYHRHLFQIPALWTKRCRYFSSCSASGYESYDGLSAIQKNKHENTDLMNDGLGALLAASSTESKRRTSVFGQSKSKSHVAETVKATEGHRKEHGSETSLTELLSVPAREQSRAWSQQSYSSDNQEIGGLEQDRKALDDSSSTFYHAEGDPATNLTSRFAVKTGDYPDPTELFNNRMVSVLNQMKSDVARQRRRVEFAERRAIDQSPQSRLYVYRHRLRLTRFHIHFLSLQIYELERKCSDPLRPDRSVIQRIFSKPPFKHLELKAKPGYKRTRSLERLHRRYILRRMFWRKRMLRRHALVWKRWNASTNRRLRLNGTRRLKLTTPTPRRLREVQRRQPFDTLWLRYRQQGPLPRFNPSETPDDRVIKISRKVWGPWRLVSIRTYGRLLKILPKKGEKRHKQESEREMPQLGLKASEASFRTQRTNAPSSGTQRNVEPSFKIRFYYFTTIRRPGEPLLRMRIWLSRRTRRDRGKRQFNEVDQVNRVETKANASLDAKSVRTESKFPKALPSKSLPQRSSEFMGNWIRVQKKKSSSDDKRKLTRLPTSALAQSERQPEPIGSSEPHTPVSVQDSTEAITMQARRQELDRDVSSKVAPDRTWPMQNALHVQTNPASGFRMFFVTSKTAQQSSQISEVIKVIKMHEANDLPKTSAIDTSSSRPAERAVPIRKYPSINRSTGPLISHVSDRQTIRGPSSRPYGTVASKSLQTSCQDSFVHQNHYLDSHASSTKSAFSLGAEKDSAAHSASPSSLLPQSPLFSFLDSRDRPPKAIPTDKSNNRLSADPFAIMLASPVRQCRATGIRLPSAFLTDWNVLRDPKSQELSLLPVGLSPNAKLFGENRFVQRPWLPPPVRATPEPEANYETPEPAASPTASSASSATETDEPPRRPVTLHPIRLLTHSALIYHLKLSFLPDPLPSGQQGKKLPVSRLLPPLWLQRGISVNDMKNVQWRMDLRELMGQLMGERVVEGVRWAVKADVEVVRETVGILSHGEKGDKAITVELDHPGALLRIRGRRDTSSPELVWREILELDGTKWKSRVPVFNAQELLGPETVQKLSNLLQEHRIDFESGFVAIDSRTVEGRAVVAELWKLKGFLGSGVDRMGEIRSK